MRIHTKREEEFIRENYRYDPETGYLWWTRQSEAQGIGLNGARGYRNLDKPAGRPTRQGYYQVNIFSKRVSSHRVAWFLYYGLWPTGLLDHVNGVKDDNRIINLRDATSLQNQGNRKKTFGCSSKYKGVIWHKRDQKWYSRVSINYKDKHLGSYDSEEEAARVYDKAAREQFGDYACLNFPDEHEQGATHGHDL